MKAECSVEEKNGTIYGIESEKNNKREKKEKRRNLWFM